MTLVLIRHARVDVDATRPADQWRLSAEGARATRLAVIRHDLSLVPATHASTSTEEGGALGERYVERLDAEVAELTVPKVLDVLERFTRPTSYRLVGLHHSMPYSAPIP